MEEKRTRLQQIVSGASERELTLLLARSAEINAAVIPELGCTLDEYNRELDQAEAEIARGEFYTQEEVVEYFKQKYAGASQVD